MFRPRLCTSIRVCPRLFILHPPPFCHTTVPPTPLLLPLVPIPQSVHNAMLALRKVVKRFEYKPKDARGPLHDIMKVTLPLLHTMSMSLLAEDSVEAGQVRDTNPTRFFYCKTTKNLTRNALVAPLPPLAVPSDYVVCCLFVKGGGGGGICERTLLYLKTCFRFCCFSSDQPLVQA